MTRTMAPTMPASINDLRQRIDRWRRTRERRTAMPAEFRAEAVALARAGRPYAVARALRLNFEALRRRMAESAAGPAAAFVELAATPMLGTAAAPGAVVELSDAAGARLTVRLTGGTELDVPGPVTAFRRRSR